MSPWVRESRLSRCGRLIEVGTRRLGFRVAVESDVFSGGAAATDTGYWWIAIRGKW